MSSRSVNSSKSDRVGSQAFDNFLESLQMPIKGSNIDKEVSKCSQCASVPMTKSALINHLKNHKGGRLRKCDICEFWCTSRNAMLKHVKIHTESKGKASKKSLSKTATHRMQKCRLCNFRTLKAAEMAAHGEEHSLEAKTMSKCPECDYTASNKLMIEHTKKHERNEISPVRKCTFCNYLTSSKFDMTRHTWSKHEILKKEVRKSRCRDRSRDEKRLKCFKCGFTTSSEATLVEHFREHDAKRREIRKCGQCDYVCLKDWAMKKHVRTCHMVNNTLRNSTQLDSSKLNDYQISNAGPIRNFRQSETTSSELQSQLAYYKGKLCPEIKEALVKCCTKCTYVPSSFKDMEEHNKEFHKVEKKTRNKAPKRISTRNLQELNENEKQTLIVGEQLRKCPECNFLSSRTEEMSLHIKRHRPKGRYACNQCSYVTESYDAMTKHNQDHSEGRVPEMLKCRQCDFSSANYSALQIHLTSHKKLKVNDCPKCTFKTIDNQKLAKHIRGHGADKVIVFDRPMQVHGSGGRRVTILGRAKAAFLKCDKCDFQTWNNRALVDHVKQHSSFDISIAVSAAKVKNSSLQREDAAVGKPTDSSDDRKTKNRCQFCQLTFSCNRGFEEHLLHHASSRVDANAQEDASKDPTDLEGSSVEKPTLLHKCYRCTFTSSSNEVFVKHLRAHYQSNPVVIKEEIDIEPELEESNMDGCNYVCVTDIEDEDLHLTSGDARFNAPTNKESISKSMNEESLDENINKSTSQELTVKSKNQEVLKVSPNSATNQGTLTGKKKSSNFQNKFEIFSQVQKSLEEAERQKIKDAASVAVVLNQDERNVETEAQENMTCSLIVKKVRDLPEDGAKVSQKVAKNEESDSKIPYVASGSESVEETICTTYKVSLESSEVPSAIESMERHVQGSEAKNKSNSKRNKVDKDCEKNVREIEEVQNDSPILEKRIIDSKDRSSQTPVKEYVSDDSEISKEKVDRSESMLLNFLDCSPGKSEKATSALGCRLKVIGRKIIFSSDVSVTKQTSGRDSQLEIAMQDVDKSMTKTDKDNAELTENPPKTVDSIDESHNCSVMLESHTEIDAPNIESETKCKAEIEDSPKSERSKDDYREKSIFVRNFDLVPQPKRIKLDDSKGSKLLFHCRYCDERYPTHNSFLNHIDVHFKPAAEKLGGDSEKPKKRKTRKKPTPKNTHFIEKVKNDPNGKQFKCLICGLQTLMRPNLLNHLNVHTKEMQHSCPVCSKSFLTGISLKEHEQTHSSRQNLKCPECGVKLPRNNLSEHMKSHSRDKPHACSQCGEGFVYESQLRRHERSHVGELKYKCNVCGKCLATEPSWQIHVAAHKSEKSFQCDFCEGRYLTKGGLSSHITLIHLRSML